MATGATTIVVFAPAVPGVPVVVTPVVYSTPAAPPGAVPQVRFAVAENLKGCAPPVPFVESD